jgi:hypothetical protein
VVGWVIGVVLLWLSPTWTAREKLIGTFVVPGGLALPISLMLFTGYTESAAVPPVARSRAPGAQRRQLR